MEEVWVRLGDEVGSFPAVTRRRKVRMNLHEILDFWKLGNASLSIGKLHALVKDRDGNSLISLCDIRHLAAESGLGDGWSRDSAIQITSWDGHISEKELEGEALEAAVQAACARDVKPQVPEVKKKSRLELELETRTRRKEEAREKLFFNPGCIYSYTKRVFGHKFKFGVAGLNQKMLEEMRGFMATVHVVADAGEDLGPQNCVGMATLWTLEGGCLTAQECFKLATTDAKLIFVWFKHLGLAYQCKVSRMESLASLEPVDQTRKFTSCVSMGCNKGSPLSCYSFELDEDGELQVVEVISIWSDVNNGLQSLIPTSRMRIMLGAPVVSGNGYQCGVVSGFTQLDVGSFPVHPLISDTDSMHANTDSMHATRFTGEELKVYVEHRFSSTGFRQGLVEGLQHQQLVHTTWSNIPVSKNPVAKWFNDHPLTEFGDN